MVRSTIDLFLDYANLLHISSAVRGLGKGCEKTHFIGENHCVTLFTCLIAYYTLKKNKSEKPVIQPTCHWFPSSDVDRTGTAWLQHLIRGLNLIEHLLGNNIESKAMDHHVQKNYFTGNSFTFLKTCFLMSSNDASTAAFTSLWFYTLFKK